MKFVRNAGNDRVVDYLGRALADGARLDLATSSFSIFAFDHLRDRLQRLRSVRLIIPEGDIDLRLLGEPADRSLRNQLRSRRIAKEALKWITDAVDLRTVPAAVPQGTIVVREDEGEAIVGLLGSLSFTTDGLGITPGNALNLVQLTESRPEAESLGQWFDSTWNSIRQSANGGAVLVDQLTRLSSHQAPYTIYALILHHLFGEREDAMDEERIVRSATGIRDTVIWNKLYSFQKDAVITAIDKLDRYGGCIIADSVGLGKTFEALAVIKYHELRNDRVLVLCPKRLRDNWTLYAANDRRNILARDRFNYDVLNHTDLSRDDGLSGDIDLSHVNWGNYDLVVIDESHNFRNKKSPKKGSETRYDRLMRRIIQEGVKTRVLMLSATPVNNRLADLRNQIAFATEGNDRALAGDGIESIDATTRQAQRQFNRWLELPDDERTTEELVERLGFDYFTLLDRLTIARSRKHVEKYYGTEETGRFPTRREPVNIKTDVDSAGEFPAIGDVNDEIRRLRLAAYAPLRYVLPHRQAAYDSRYSTSIRGGESVFRQADREESLIHLMRVNLLKRMESSVASFRLTLGRQLAAVENLLERIDNHEPDVDEPDIEEVDFDDPEMESLLVGRRVKVLLSDVDRIKWRQDLREDRDRLMYLLAVAKNVLPSRDAKLDHLRSMIAKKVSQPINDGNRKILVFTAFSDTAEYLYDNLSGWARTDLGIDSAIVTGSGRNDSTIDGLRRNMAAILSAFAPRAKERPADLADEGQIDLLIATDCISEGQNLQDCDWVVNYDIHWNPVRIIQRFGRIDRIGSPNEQIQLVNFWPNVELEEYINLEQRVSGRMVLLDVSATGEENIIEKQSGDPMNDLHYRREQLMRMQDAVLDMEDLSGGVSITDLTLTDFRLDLARYLKANPEALEDAPFGLSAVVSAEDTDIPPGTVFCLRAEGEAALRAAPPGYPLAPLYLVHVGEDDAVLLPFTQAKQILDRIKRLCLGRSVPDAAACEQMDRQTRDGADMRTTRDRLARAAQSVIGKSEERAVASLFSPGGTHALEGGFAGSEDFEVVAFLEIIPVKAT